MTSPVHSSSEGPIASTGVPGLDDIIGGGFVRRRLYLVEGVPGSGKTTLALQFLLDGAARGEAVLYVTISESAEELRAVARSHGWDLSKVGICELTPSEDFLRGDDQLTMFHASEVELAATTRLILRDVERLKPTRVVLDSLSEFRLLAGNVLQYRRQILALKQFFATRDSTVVLLDDMTARDHDLQMQSIAHAVVLLEQLNAEYGADRRRLRVVKYRAVSFRGGYHDYVINRGGLTVFPRLVAAEHRQTAPQAPLASGLRELDELLGGGISEGTSTLLIGAAGTGKSTLAALFGIAAAKAGKRAAFFLFDEGPQTLIVRCQQLGMDLQPHIEVGGVVLKQVDPAELTPGELVHTIRQEVEEAGANVVVIDSLNGYLNAMPGERFLAVQLHELLMYLGQKNVATILIGAQHGVIGTQMATPIDTSYLADAVVLLRYYEVDGEVRQAISVIKKRGGRHERTLRDFRLDGGIKVGRPLRHLRGVLTGVPTPQEGRNTEGGDHG